MNITEHQQRFEEWTREHGAILYRVVNGFAIGDDRNDLLQEVLLAVWKSIPAYRGQAKPTTYLYRVCHNAGLLWLRTQKNYRRRIDQLSAFPSDHFAPASDPCADERLSAVYRAIHELKPGDRSLILLALDGLSYREMADVLGLSESNVGVKLNRLKNQLSKTVKGNENEPQ